MCFFRLCGAVGWVFYWQAQDWSLHTSPPSKISGKHKPFRLQSSLMLHEGLIYAWSGGCKISNFPLWWPRRQRKRKVPGSFSLLESEKFKGLSSFEILICLYMLKASVFSLMEWKESSDFSLPLPTALTMAQVKTTVLLTIYLLWD